MKALLHKNTFKLVIAGTIALSPLAANFAFQPHDAHAATAVTLGTTDIVSFHDGIFKKLTASDVADIKVAYSNVSKINFSTVLGASLIEKIDAKTSKGTAVKLAADLAKLEYKTNTTEFKTALDTFKKDHAADFTKIFDGKLSVDQAISLFAAFEGNLETKLVTSFIENDHKSFNELVTDAIVTTLNQKEFAGLDGLFSQKLGVSINNLLTMKINAEKTADPSQSASAALSSGLIRSRGGDIYGSSTVTLGATAPTYSFKVALLGDLSKGVVWKTTNSSIAYFTGNKLVAKKTGTVKVQAYYLNMPIITKEVTVKLKDTTAPAMPTVNPFSNKDKVMSGKAESYSIITVKAGKTTVATGNTTSKGIFSLSIKAQNAGTVLSVTAKDAAGNVSKVRTIKVLDKIAPATPAVYTVDNNDKVIKGKAEKYSFITVKHGKTTIAKGKAASNGTFTLTMKAQKAGYVLIVTATDAAGNVSKARTVKVLDKTAPSKPIVYSVHSKDKVVSGKAEAGSMITISYGSKVLATGKTSIHGNFSVKIPAQRKGTILYITAKDTAKNVSKSTKIIVK